jgi:hypothetical protein
MAKTIHLKTTAVSSMRHPQGITGRRGYVQLV